MWPVLRCPAELLDKRIAYEFRLGNHGAPSQISHWVLLCPRLKANKICLLGCFSTIRHTNTFQSRNVLISWNSPCSKISEVLVIKSSFGNAPFTYFFFLADCMRMWCQLNYLMRNKLATYHSSILLIYYWHNVLLRKQKGNEPLTFGDSDLPHLNR